jgi:hypothetical protein
MSEAAIRKQVEFYFSDSSYRKDVFLKTVADGDPEGWVPITVLLTFNKLKSITTNPEEVANALVASSSVVVSEDKNRIRRTVPLPENDTSQARTLYVKGYPVEDPDVSIESIAESFSTYGNINLVRIRKDHVTRAFKGSVFIEFDNEDSVKTACQAAYKDGSTDCQLSYKEKPFDCVLPLTEW